MVVRELQSWKEIAAHLGVNVRTAQKWEAERGLPVRHLPGPRRGRVHTTAGELDAWKTSATPQAAVHDSPQLVARKTRPHAAIIGIAGVLGILLAAAAFAMLWPRPPASYRVSQHALIMLDDHGREIWRKSFPSLYDAAYEHEGVWTGDLGDGRITVLFLQYTTTSGPTSLIAYNTDGSERWRFTPGQAVHTATESFPATFRPEHFLVSPLGRDHKLRIVVTSTHNTAYPCQLALLDSNGRVLREYWHSGHLQHLLATDLDQRGWNLLVVAGINNARKAATLLVLDPDHFTGASQEDNPSYQLQGFPPPVEIARVFFPRSTMNKTLEPFPSVTRLQTDGDGLLLDVQQRLSPPDATILYRLRPNLALNSVELSTSFERAQLWLQATGILRPFTPDDIEDLHHLTYLVKTTRE